MTKSESSDRLGVSIDAPIVEIEQKYRELYKEVKTRLDDAPTTSLKRKYQSELQTLQEAFDTLCPSAQHNNDYPTDTPLYDEEGGTSGTSQAMGGPPPAPTAAPRRWLYVGGFLLVCVLGAVAYTAVARVQERRKVQEEAVERQRDADEAARKQRDADAAAQSQRDADAAAQRQRAADEAAQEQRDADAAAQKQHDAEDAAQRQRAADAAAQRQRQAEAAQAAAATREREQHAADLKAAQERAEKAERDAAAAREAAIQAQNHSHKSDDDDKPKTARITVQYTGDMGACALALRVTIGDKSFHPSSNEFRVSGVPVGDQDYRISGTIGCPGVGTCEARGSGSVDVSDGDTFNVTWANTSFGRCTVELN